MLQRILEAIEPADVYEQALLPKSKQSLRMRLSNAFYHMFKRWL
jgi:hypothetical protein